MGRSRKFSFGFVALALVFVSACELVADFDRSKIPVDKADSGALIKDGSISDDSDSGSADDAKK